MTGRALGFAFVTTLCAGAALSAQHDSHVGKHKTEHFEIRYRPDSKAGASVERVAKLAELELAQICAQLGVEVSGPVRALSLRRCRGPEQDYGHERQRRFFRGPG